MNAPTLTVSQSSLVLSPEDGSSNPGSEYNPAVSGLADGSFVALWDEFLSPTSDADGGTSSVIRVVGRDGALLGRSAQPVSGDLRGNFGGLGLVVTLSGGRVAVAWDAGDTTASRVGARIIDPKTGGPVGPELTISAPGRGTGEDILLHGLVPLPDGSAGVLYVDRQGDAVFANRLRLAVLKPDGSQGSDVVLLQPESAFSPGLASLGAAQTVTVLSGVNAGVIALLTRDPLSNAIGLQFFNSAGETVRPALSIGDTGGALPTIFPLADGAAAVIWGSDGSSGGSLYRMLRIPPQGSALASPVEIPFDGGFFGSHDVVGLPDGGWLLAATVVAAGGGFRSEIALQRLKANDRTDGPALTIGHPDSRYASPRLALSGEDKAVLAYQDGSQILASRLVIRQPGAYQERSPLGVLL